MRSRRVRSKGKERLRVRGRQAYQDCILSKILYIYLVEQSEKARRSESYIRRSVIVLSRASPESMKTSKGTPSSTTTSQKPGSSHPFVNRSLREHMKLEQRVTCAFRQRLYFQVQIHAKQYLAIMVSTSPYWSMFKGRATRYTRS